MKKHIDKYAKGKLLYTQGVKEAQKYQPVYGEKVVMMT
jgi:hypothetical protein